MKQDLELTDRVGALLQKGLTQAEVGRKLGMSRRAVHYHKEKLNLRKAHQRRKVAPRPAVDWRIYNAALVRRGEFLLDLSFVEEEQEQIRDLNWEKRGRPYRYSQELIHFAAVIKLAFKLDYRSTEGLLRKLLPLLGLRAMDYSTLCERMGRLPKELRVYEPQGEQGVAIDSTGRSQGLRGSYRESRYATQPRKFVKLHVSVNVKTRQVQSMSVTHGHASDIRQAAGLLREAREHGPVRKLLGDAAYDSAELRGDVLEGGGQNAIRLNAIKSPEDPVQLAREARRRLEKKPDPRHRRLAIGTLDRLQNTELGDRTYEAWRDRVDYGDRAYVESFFSREVRYFGDHVRSRTLAKAAVELVIRVSLMNLFMKLTQCRSAEEVQSFNPQSFPGP